ncbi:SpoIIE family protein phosphatase [Streptomyces sp. H27-G5]|uniref:PP2C family protein-serine/threonine phosphatase n=1 Tax=Streptomyces sp. H27-G5 TaxID=2996698 RepID=UPI002271A03B|nr:GAF domain-containing SpoIIE family protein phosphatase [Streptomyces sp. H27-G5]MCY0923815.1 SpoIIE family protein phosphatase [Streptomyces sp. H27-G5]
MPQAGHAIGPAGTPGRQTLSAAEEAARMDAVRRYDILDTPPDGAFDRVAAMAARLFKVPVASVTIVDEDRIWFKAAHGLEGVSEISREPGLCGSAILADETLVIPDTLTDPVAFNNGLVTGPMAVRFYAAAPITTRDGHRLGTVNILDTTPRLITEDDTATLADLAAIVLDELEMRLAALNALRAEQKRRREQEEARQRAERDKNAIEAFASTLQRTLLPPALPVVPGLELACHYATASPQNVGGDFYDVFPLDGARWAFFLGDVCGKGPEAAALTSLTRYTLRAAALIDPDPDVVLTSLNTALLLDPAIGTQFCTAVFGVLEPHEKEGFTITVATGGHPPAYHLRGQGTVEAVHPKGGMLIGAVDGAHFASHSIHLAPGEALLLYTDGLTEARTLGGDMIGEDGLTRFLAARTGPVSAAQVIEDTVDLIDAMPHGAGDDVALLALSVPLTDSADALTTTATAHTIAPASETPESRP